MPGVGLRLQKKIDEELSGAEGGLAGILEAN